jgi:glycerol-3-phosphate acyltransferase PlsY
MFALVSALALSYLLGSVPTAYIFTKLLLGADIRQLGSANVGASNVFRSVGKLAGVAVLAIDVAKGFLSVVVLGDLFLRFNLPVREIPFRVLLALASVIGHNWMIFLRFKGGKGVATSLGAWLGLSLKVPGLNFILMICLGIWIGIVAITGYISLGSIIATCLAPVFMLVMYQPFEIILLGAVFCIFILLRHKPNIKRLLRGQELKILRRPKSQ